MNSGKKSGLRLFTEQEISGARRRPSPLGEWLEERRRAAIRRMSPAERMEHFRAHQRMLGEFLEAGKTYRGGGKK